MGYESYVTDFDLTVENLPVSKNWAVAAETGDYAMDTLTYILGLTVEDDKPIWFDTGQMNAGKAYHLAFDLKPFISAVGRYGGRVVGSFVLVGEQWDDIVRYSVEDEKVIMTTAKIVFD